MVFAFITPKHSLITWMNVVNHGGRKILLRISMTTGVRPISFVPNGNIRTSYCFESKKRSGQISTRLLISSSRCSYCNSYFRYRGGRHWFISALKARGLSILKLHRSGSRFTPARFIKGKQGRSKTSSSCDMALKGAMSTPIALMLRQGGIWA